jgi:hypothetical protein
VDANRIRIIFFLKVILSRLAKHKLLEVVSKFQIRFKVKASSRSRKRSPPEADEHLSEACNAGLGP